MQKKRENNFRLQTSDFRLQTSDFRLIFMGTPDFAVPILKKLIAEGWKLVAVITQPDKKIGREQKLVYSPVKKLALEYNIPIYQPEKLNQDIEQKISSLNPDLIVLAAYGKILPKSILDIPKYGSINVHPSLLPKYRGASPISAAILSGETETGITIILMDEKMDHGPIIAQKKDKIYPDDTGESLSLRLANSGAELLVKTLPKWFEGKIKPKPQEHSKATYTKMLSREDGRIIWTSSAEQIERQIRAFYPWPGTWTVWNDKRLKLLPVASYQLPVTKITKKPGEVFLTEDKNLAVACGRGYLIINKLQLEGKKKMDAFEFLKGYSRIIGSILK